MGKRVQLSTFEGPNGSFTAICSEADGGFRPGFIDNQTGWHTIWSDILSSEAAAEVATLRAKSEANKSCKS